MTDTLWKLAAEGPREALLDAYGRLMDLTEEPWLSLSLFDLGGQRVTLEALYQDAPDESAFLDAAGLTGAPDVSVASGRLGDEDWVAKSLEGLPPVSAGRFFVFGGHDRDKLPAGAVPILIEAGQAFGTGHHGTTKGCLIAFDRLITGGARFENILDLGCGAGTLALAAAHVTDAEIAASDNDPEAIEVTEANLRDNALSGRAAVILAEGLDAPALAQRAPYDLIFANILAGPLVALAADIAQACAPGGRAILSGLLTEQRDWVLDAYLAAGLTLEAEDALDGWSVLVVRKD